MPRVAARIVVPDTPEQAMTVDVFTPWEAAEIIKATVPSSARRWNPIRKCWHIHEWAVTDLRDQLRAYGYTVAVTTKSGQPWPRVPVAQPPPPPPGGPFAWLPAAFADATDVERLRTALLRAWHPDHGHDPGIAVLINTAANNRRRNR